MKLQKLLILYFATWVMFFLNVYAGNNRLFKKSPSLPTIWEDIIKNDKVDAYMNMLKKINFSLEKNINWYLQNYEPMDKRNGYNRAAKLKIERLKKSLIPYDDSHSKNNYDQSELKKYMNELHNQGYLSDKQYAFIADKHLLSCENDYLERNYECDTDEDI